MKILFKFDKLNAGHLPVILAIFFTTTLGLTYCISVYRGDVNSFFPYISASANNRPESCFFSLLLNLCVFFLIIIVLLRYNLIKELNRNMDEVLKLVNKLCYYVGLFGILGMFVVANFQETAIIQIHLLGAIVCFGFGCIYMIGQSWITYRMYPLFTNKRIAIVRTIIALCGTLFFVVALSCGFLAAYVFHKHFPNLPTPRPWNRQFLPMPGYTLHCVSAIAEWISAVLQISFFLSYSQEFEKIRVNLLVQPLVTHLDISPIMSDNDENTP